MKKVLKALLPMVLIIIVRLSIDLTSISHHENMLYLLRRLLFTNAPFLITLIVAFVYFNRHNGLKISLIILSIFVLLNIFIQFGPTFVSIVFDTSVRISVMFDIFSLIFYIFISVLALYFAIRNKKIEAVFFASISILLVVYIELIYIPDLQSIYYEGYLPYKEFRAFFHEGFYRSIYESMFAVVMISSPVFTIFYSFLKSFR